MRGRAVAMMVPSSATTKIASNRPTVAPARARRRLTPDSTPGDAAHRASRVPLRFAAAPDQRVAAPTASPTPIAQRDGARDHPLQALLERRLAARDDCYTRFG